MDLINLPFKAKTKKITYHQNFTKYKFKFIHHHPFKKYPQIANKGHTKSF